MTKGTVPVRDDSVGEAYANKIVNITYDGSAAVVTLGAVRSVPDAIGPGAVPKADSVVVVTHRIALSRTAAVELHNMLGQALSATSKRRPARTQN